MYYNTLASTRRSGAASRKIFNSGLNSRPCCCYSSCHGCYCSRSCCCSCSYYCFRCWLLLLLLLMMWLLLCPFWNAAPLDVIPKFLSLNRASHFQIVRIPHYCRRERRDKNSYRDPTHTKTLVGFEVLDHKNSRNGVPQQVIWQ